VQFLGQGLNHDWILPGTKGVPAGRRLPRCYRMPRHRLPIASEVGLPASFVQAGLLDVKSHFDKTAGLCVCNGRGHCCGVLTDPWPRRGHQHHDPEAYLAEILLIAGDSGPSRSAPHSR